MMWYDDFVKLMSSEDILVKHTMCDPNIVRYYYYQKGVIYYDETINGVVHYRRIESIANLSILYAWIIEEQENYSIINMSHKLHSKRCIT